MKMEIENTKHDEWFKNFYSDGYKLREHKAYLFSLWAWQARADIKLAIKGQTNDSAKSQD